MNIQEMVAALRACADGRCEECPLENEDFTCGSNLLSETAGAVEAMAAELEKLRRPGPGWIPVTERLPEKYTAVLAAGNGEVACGLFVGFAEPAHVASWDLDNVAAEPVTHWMPLPEPPEGGRGGKGGEQR